jgi:alpha-D-ribose 1-methylphosphonate 5-phosphate C-P lyase
LFTHFSSLNAHYVFSPSHPPWFDHPNNIWRQQIIELFMSLHPSHVQIFSLPPWSQTQPIIIIVIITLCWL